MFRRMLRRGSTGYYKPQRVGRRAFRKVRSMIFSAIFLVIIIAYFLITNR